MNDQELLNEMIAQNPWWSNKTPDLPEKVVERDIFPLLKNELKEREVVGLVGLRSVGKTTLMKQLIKSLLDDKIDPQHILYFSLDGFKNEEAMIRRLLTLYSHNILKLTFNDLDQKLYVFFDEVQKISGWGEEVKSYYDKNLKLKFVVSGSSSMNILKGSGESLVGRIIIHRAYPFSFREFLRYRGLNIRKSAFWNREYPLQGEKIAILFEEYAGLGGFPVLYDVAEERKKPLLKSMVDLTFYRDILNIFDVKRTDVLEGLFYVFKRESGNVVNYANLSSALNTKFETIKSYIDYLNTSFMISKSRFFSKSKVKSLEKKEKVYVADHAFGMLQEIKYGNKVETIVYNALKSAGYDLFYWRDEKKNEVDVIALDKLPVPIEVKYQSKISDSDLKGLCNFLDKHEITRGILVTKNLLETRKRKNKEIHCVPAWLFLLST